MDLATRKKELYHILLDSDYDYDLIIYKLLKKDILDDVIIKIDNKSICSDVNPEEVISSNEQFLMLLNRLVYWFVENFPTLVEYRTIIIEMIIKSNKKRIEQYLLSKHYLGDNSYIDFFCKSVYTILFANFITNIKDMPIIKQLLEEEHIEYKNIDTYSVNELKSIKDLLEKIGICNYEDSFQFTYVFLDIETSINKKINSYKKDEKRTNKIIDEIYTSTINFYQNIYYILIENYKEKKNLFL